MNKNVKAVFEMLGVEPNEEFEVRFSDNSISYFKHRITEKLNTEWFDVKINYWGKDSDCKYLKNLLAGEYKIIKQSKFTEAEQKAIELFKMLGYKYIAKNFNDDVLAYKNEPYKYGEIWEGDYIGGAHLPIGLNFNSLSWSDEEPYYIGD